jgi:hypothetical protein
VLHDLLVTRYQQQLWWRAEPPPELQRFLMRVVHIVIQDLVPALQLEREFFRAVHDVLARELGVPRLAQGNTYDEMCGRFLVEPYDLWNDAHGTSDEFLKSRLSLVELLFRAMEQRVAPQATAGKKRSLLKMLKQGSAASNSAGAQATLEKAIRELNARMRDAKLGFHYHNGVLQFARDEVLERISAEPCWALLREERWSSAERELKEAFDAADNRRSDAAFHAAKALESVIKVISDEKGWTRGAENGAASFIDNLVNQHNGRFIVPWEAELLKAFFKHVRNPHGHGAGSQPPPLLTENQTAWALETAMSWMKSLILRF